MIIRVIKSARDVVAVCDSDLIGRRFEEGDLQLDIKENFYGKEKFSEPEAMIILKKMQREDATFNIVGKKSINTALKAGIIEKGWVKEVKGVPFALVLL